MTFYHQPRQVRKEAAVVAKVGVATILTLVLTYKYTGNNTYVLYRTS